MTRPKKDTGFNRAARRRPRPLAASDTLTPRHKGYIRDHNGVTDAASGRTRLIDAVITGDLDLATRLLRSGANANLADKLGRTALHHAAAAGQAPFIDLLLARGADANLQTRNEDTALTLLLEKADHVQLAPRLLAAGADANIPNKKGILPLHLAALHGSAAKGLEVIEALVLATADPNQRDGTGASALHYAARGGDARVLELLRFHRLDVFAADHEANTCLHDAARHQNPAAAQFLLRDWAVELLNAVNHDGRTPLHLAVDAGHAQVVKDMLDHGAVANRYDSKGMTPLHLAVRKGGLLLTQALIAQGAGIDAADGKGGVSPLMVAVNENRRDLALVLLQAGANPNRATDEGLTPLMAAAGTGKPLLADLLLEHGADPSRTDKQGRNVLHYADDRLSAKMVERLVLAGADLEAKNRWGRTPLLEALTGPHPVLAALLMQLGAKVTVQDDLGRTPLHLALFHRRPDLAGTIVAKGADVTAAEREYGWTPLHVAAQTGQLNEVRRLLAHKADPRVADSSGRLPMHLAVSNVNGVEAVIRHFLDIGVDALAKDNQGFTAYDYAHSQRREEIIRIFKAHFQKRGVAYQPRHVSPYLWPPFGR